MGGGAGQQAAATGGQFIPARQSPALTTTPLRFNPPKNFSGREEDWDLFQYKFNAYMALTHSRFTCIFKIAQEAGSHPIPFDVDLENGEIALSHMLWNARISL